MKKAILVLTLALISAATFAQQQPKKKLPAILTISLKDVDVVALFNKIDSLQTFAMRSDIPSVDILKFNNRVNQVLSPLYAEISKQMIEEKPVTDSTKAVKPKVKKDH